MGGLILRVVVLFLHLKGGCCPSRVILQQIGHERDSAVQGVPLTFNRRQPPIYTREWALGGQFCQAEFSV